MEDEFDKNYMGHDFYSIHENQDYKCLKCGVFLYKAIFKGFGDYAKHFSEDGMYMHDNSGNHGINSIFLSPHLTCDEVIIKQIIE